MDQHTFFVFKSWIRWLNYFACFTTAEYDVFSFNLQKMGKGFNRQRNRKRDRRLGEPQYDAEGKQVGSKEVLLVLLLLDGSGQIFR